MAVSKRSYLCEMEEKLVSSLGNCKYTTEMLFAIHSLDRVCAGRTPRTPQLLELALNEKQSSITDAVSSFFEELSDWGRIALGWIAYSKRSPRLGKFATAVAITDHTRRRAYYGHSLRLFVIAQIHRSRQRRVAKGQRIQAAPWTALRLDGIRGSFSTHYRTRGDTGN